MSRQGHGAGRRVLARPRYALRSAECVCADKLKCIPGRRTDTTQGSTGLQLPSLSFAVGPNAMHRQSPWYDLFDVRRDQNYKVSKHTK